MTQETWDWKAQSGEKAPSDTTSIGEEVINPSLVPGLTSIIVVAYNITYPLLHFTATCLGSIRENTDKNKTPYEIILVDNGSTIRFSDKPSDWPVKKYIRNESNLGVAHAWNQGIRVSSGEYLCFLNNDTMVFEHWLEDLLEGLNYRDLVMATPMYGEPFSRAVESKNKRQVWVDRPYEESLSDFRDFSCVLTKKEIFNKLGLFDERFFAYNEDLDLMKRMDLAAMKYGSTKRVPIFHVIGGTSNQSKELNEAMAQYMNENREKLKNKVYEDTPVVESEKVSEPIKEEIKTWGEDVPSEEPEPKVHTIDDLPALARTSETGDKVFFIKDKSAYWVTSPEVLETLGYSFGDVVAIPKELFYQLDFGENLTLENVAKYKKNEGA